MFILEVHMWWTCCADLIDRKETKGCRRGCPVLTESAFLCPHVFSTWPSAKACPFPPLTTREFQEAVLYTGFGLNVLVCAAVVLLTTTFLIG